MDKITLIGLLKDMEGEMWKPLYKYKNYLISNFGRIKSIERDVFIGIRNGVKYYRYKPQHFIAYRTNGIEEFLFTDIHYRDRKGNKFTKTIYIHKAVCDHFVKKPRHVAKYEREGGHICATHIIKDYENNKFDNVKWITQIELIQSQPQRLANPTKAWETRRVIYGSTGSNPDSKTGKVKRTRKPKTIIQAEIPVEDYETVL